MSECTPGFIILCWSSAQLWPEDGNQVPEVFERLPVNAETLIEKFSSPSGFGPLLEAGQSF